MIFLEIYSSSQFRVSGLSLLRKAFSVYCKGHKGFRKERNQLNINKYDLHPSHFLGVLCGFFSFSEWTQVSNFQLLPYGKPNIYY